MVVVWNQVLLDWLVIQQEISCTLMTAVITEQGHWSGMKTRFGPSTVTQHANPLPEVHRHCSRCFTPSIQQPANVLEKAASSRGWPYCLAPAPVRVIWKKLLTSRFGPGNLWLLWPCQEWTRGRRSISLLPSHLSYLCNCLSNKKNKAF